MNIHKLFIPIRPRVCAEVQKPARFVARGQSTFLSAFFCRNIHDDADDGLRQAGVHPFISGVAATPRLRVLKLRFYVFNPEGFEPLAGG